MGLFSVFFFRRCVQTLTGDQFGEESVFRDQLVIGAVFDDAAFVQHEDAQTTLGEEQNTNDEDETSIAGIGGSDSTLLSG